MEHRLESTLRILIAGIKCEAGPDQVADGNNLLAIEQALTNFMADPAVSDRPICKFINFTW